MRLLHRILPTEQYLHRCRLVESPLCNFCRQEPETLQHLFWTCEIVNQFWEALTLLIQDKCPHTHHLRFEEKLILFGKSENVWTDKGLDMLIIWSKFFVYKAKLAKTQPRIQACMQTLNLRWMMERYISTVNGSQTKFDRIWSPYLPLFELNN